MELLGDVGNMESRFDLFGDSVCAGGRLAHALQRTYCRLRNSIGGTRWNS
jgi:hypothetical protein